MEATRPSGARGSREPDRLNGPCRRGHASAHAGGGLALPDGTRRFIAVPRADVASGPRGLADLKLCVARAASSTSADVETRCPALYSLRARDSKRRGSDAGEHAGALGQRQHRAALDDRGARAAGAGAGRHHHDLGRAGHGPERRLQHPQDHRDRDLPAGTGPAGVALGASGAVAAGRPARLAGAARAHHPCAPLPRPVPDADHRLPLHRHGRLPGAVLHALRPRAASCPKTSRWPRSSSTPI